MRVRALFVMMTVVGLLVAMPDGARAGGNWLDIRRDDGERGGLWKTWSGPFVPGTALEVRTSVYAKSERAQDRLRHSAPYYAWIAPQRGSADSNGLPAGSVRLSAFELRRTSARSAVVKASFVLPVLPSGKYTIEVCNDPCSFSGFGEYVQGWTSIVQSAEALALSRQNERVEMKLWRARQDVARAHRGVEDLEADLDDSEATRASLTARVSVLADELSSARRRAQAAASIPDGPIVDPWIGALLAVAALSLAVALANRRRAGRIAIPGTA